MQGPLRLRLREKRGRKQLRRGRGASGRPAVSAGQLPGADKAAFKGPREQMLQVRPYFSSHSLSHRLCVSVAQR